MAETFVMGGKRTTAKASTIKQQCVVEAACNFQKERDEMERYECQPRTRLLGYPRLKEKKMCKYKQKNKDRKNTKAPSVNTSGSASLFFFCIIRDIDSLFTRNQSSALKKMNSMLQLWIFFLFRAYSETQTVFQMLRSIPYRTTIKTHALLGTLWCANNFERHAQNFQGRAAQLNFGQPRRACASHTR